MQTEPEPGSPRDTVGDSGRTLSGVGWADDHTIICTTCEGHGHSSWGDQVCRNCKGTGKVPVRVRKRDGKIISAYTGRSNLPGINKGKQDEQLEEAKSLGDELIQAWSDIYGLTPGSDRGLEYFDQRKQGTLYGQWEERMYNNEIDGLEEIEDLPNFASDKELLKMIEELQDIYSDALFDVEGAVDTAKARHRFKKESTFDEEYNKYGPEGPGFINYRQEQPHEKKQREKWEKEDKEKAGKKEKRTKKTSDAMMKFRESGDPYGGSMFSPYDNEYNDNDIDSAFEEADDWVSSEHIDAEDPDQINDLKHGLERYLEQIGKGGALSDEEMQSIIQRYYPASALDTLKTDMAKDPALKTRFGDDPQAVIQKYQKRDI